MIKINDGTQTKRIAGKAGDRTPQTGLKRDRAVYVAAGGETSIDLSLLSPAISYMPGMNQLTVKRSSVGDLISGYSFFERTTSSVGFSTALIAGEWVEIIKEVQISGIQAATLRPDLYSVTATNGQTLITADFSWPYNLNPTKGIGGCEVYLHGILQTRGVDYTEVNLGTSNTNQIQFTDALSGGENVIVKPTYQVIDQSAAASTFYGQQITNIQSAMATATQPFVGVPNTLTAPYSTVVNRAKLPDLSNDLKVSFGIERIMTQAIYNIQGESGPTGEPVHGAFNDDRGLIRFVGAGWSSYNGLYGQMALGTLINDYVEVTFYGTGLNLLTAAANFSRDIRATVDGYAEGSNLYNQTSTLLTGRNYSSNVVCPIVSGLTIGVHTVKIRLNSSSMDLPVHGFEIINSASVSNLSINPGSAYINGLRYNLAASQSLSYSGAASGTKGGRSVVYIKSDGTIGQVFTAVNPSPAYLTSADHTNEEVARTYFPREFGSNRSDDFSRTAPVAYGSLGSALSFTLDDGTTSLTTSSGDFVSGLSKEALACRVATGTQFISFTFIGTGLDVELLTDSIARQFDSITVDGTVVNTAITKAASSNPDIRKIASGLPYGTHTIRFNISGTQDSLAIARFIVYQPKKPTAPSGAVELADYNVMADYAASSTAAVGLVASGVVRKMGYREFAYSGTWTIAADANAVSYFDNVVPGYNIGTSTASSSFSYTFFGTGCEIGTWFSAAAYNLTLSIDNSTNLSSYTTALIQPGTGLTLTSGTGVISGTSSTGGRGRIRVSRLALGLHTVKITQNVTTGTLYADTIDVITPLHSYKQNLYSDLQNTLNVGSNSLTDLRKTSMIKDQLPAIKSWAQATGVLSAPTTTSTSLVPMPDMSLTMKSSGGPIEIFYSCAVTNQTSGQGVYLVIYLDGQAVSGDRAAECTTANYYYTVSDSLILNASAGFHKIDVYWRVSAGTATARTTSRILKVREI